jgi:hypothetical protein
MYQQVLGFHRPSKIFMYQPTGLGFSSPFQNFYVSTGLGFSSPFQNFMPDILESKSLVSTLQGRLILIQELENHS